MAEISGYGPSTNSYAQTVQNKVLDSGERLNENKVGRLEGLKGVEVILSSNQELSEFDTYEGMEKAKPTRFSPTEQRAIDDLDYEQRNSNANAPDPSDAGVQERRALDSML